MSKSIISFIVSIIFILVVSTSCSKDDSISEVDVTTQNNMDDEAIIKYLKNHYFGSNGKVTALSSTASENVGKTSLYKLATKDPSGFWYVSNPSVTANGYMPDSNDSIYVHYNLNYFVAQTVSDTITYGTISTSNISTIDAGNGLPAKNPFFYKKPYTATEADTYYVMEGIRDGLVKFKSTSTELSSPYNLQGVIIAPSRLVYARDNSYLSLRNASVILNFQTYQAYSK